ncbi:MAG: hypothetical protein EU535_07780 [Promethearchaeota archaeon]|nr:MAG: hypothetical protein EU535_07780 [Candidatus Lokiarchaeota archaeon]
MLRIQEFKINEYITLKLENKETIIYIAGKRFRQCKFLLLNIPVDKIRSIDELESIDEAAERLDISMEGGARKNISIPLEVEFWGHCSNLQVWSEHDYDTRLLHSNLAFPLLKRLTEEGDPLAKKVFKEEIAKRIESAYPPVISYLMIELRYFDLLSNEEISAIFENTQLIKKIIYGLKKQKFYIEGWGYEFCNYFSKRIPELFEKELLEFLKDCDSSDIIVFVDYEFNKFIKRKEVLKLLFDSNYKFSEELKRIEIDNDFAIYKLFYKEDKDYSLNPFMEIILKCINENNLSIINLVFLNVFKAIDKQYLKEIIYLIHEDLKKNLIKIFNLIFKITNVDKLSFVRRFIETLILLNNVDSLFFKSILNKLSEEQKLLIKKEISNK